MWHVASQPLELPQLQALPPALPSLSAQACISDSRFEGPAPLPPFWPKAGVAGGVLALKST